MGLEMFRKSLELLKLVICRYFNKRIKKEEARRGFILAAPNTIKAYLSFEAKIYILTKKEGGRHKPFVSNISHNFFSELLI